MKLIASLFLASCVALAGCGNSNPEPKTPSAPVSEPPVKSGRRDLPINWFEVTQDNWSYGLPTGFDAVKLSPKFGLLAQHHSVVRQMDISFTIHPTEMKDVHQYVLADFIMPSIIGGKQVIATAESRTKDNKAVLAVQLLSDGMNLSEERIRNKAFYDGSLEFFILEDGKVYHMSCFAEAMTLKNNSEICFKVIDSLRIK